MYSPLLLQECLSHSLDSCWIESSVGNDGRESRGGARSAGHKPSSFLRLQRYDSAHALQPLRVQRCPTQATGRQALMLLCRRAAFPLRRPGKEGMSHEETLLNCGCRDRTGVAGVKVPCLSAKRIRIKNDGPPRSSAGRHPSSQWPESSHLAYGSGVASKTHSHVKQLALRRNHCLYLAYILLVFVIICCSWLRKINRIKNLHRPDSERTGLTKPL